jgi:hypothetical protein
VQTLAQFAPCLRENVSLNSSLCLLTKLCTHMQGLCF